MELKESSMETIGGGIGPKLFRKGIEQILDNIADEATNPTIKRKINMSFSFKPDEDRHLTKVEVKMSTTLAQVGAKEAVVYLGLDHDGEYRMTNSDPKQLELADQLKVIPGQKEA